MPNVSEIMDANAMDVSGEGESSLQVSSTSPEVPPTSNSRALHVRQGNMKSSRSGSRSSGSSRSSLPPLMDRQPSRDRPASREASHRGPGSMQLHDHRSISHHDDQRVLQVNQDQRSVVHRHEHNSQVNQDQRSFTHNQDQRVLQLNVGVSPEHVIEREANVISQAHAAINEVRSQSAQEVDAMRNHVASVHQQVQVHTMNVERHANDLLSDLQVRHQDEIAQLQSIANVAHQESQHRYDMVQAENQQLLERIRIQEEQLRTQRDEQKELRSVIRSLQDQVGLLRSQPNASSPQNGAVDQHDLMQVMLQLQNDVRNLQERSPIPIVAQPPVHFPIATPPTRSLTGLSACAGEPPRSQHSASRSGSDKKGGKSPVVQLTFSTPTGATQNSSGGSSPSSSESDGGGGGGGFPGSPHFSEDPHEMRGNLSIGVGSNVLGFMLEKDVYRSKDLTLIKIESLPTSASEFRVWRNTFLTKVASIDQTGQDVILGWVMQSFAEGRDPSEFVDSGLLPRLDAHLGSLLMDSRHLKGELGMRFQTYAEACQMAMKAPRGRSLLAMIAQHFRLDLNRGSNLTQQALLDLQLDGFAPKDLEKFVERIEYVLNAIPQSHQPSEITKFTWLYSRVKKCKMLQRHIDRIRDSRETSHCRTWDWLMSKIKAMLIEVREDTNEESIRASLQSRAKPKPDPKAVVAQDADDDAKAKGLPNPSSKPKAKPKAGSPSKAGDQGEKGGKGGSQPKAGNPKGKGKGKGNEVKKDAQAKPKAEPKAGNKATVPCLFWPQGTCNRGDACPFLHDPRAKPAAKPKAAAPANAKATVAVLAASSGVSGASAFRPSGAQSVSSSMSILKSSLRAIVRPFFALMSIISSCVTPQGIASLATLHDTSSSLQYPGAPAVLHHEQSALIAQSKSNQITLEWIADSGAGRDLASDRAFADQGVSQSVIQSCTQSTSPIKFETGNGSYTADTCVSMNGSSFGHANFSVMQDCPIVRSLGQIVANGKPFVWLPDQLPFFCQNKDCLQVAFDSTKIHTASRVEDFVPIFKETFQVNETFALPAEGVVGEVPVDEEPIPVPKSIQHEDAHVGYGSPHSEVPAVEGELSSDADSEPVDEDPLPRAQRLQAEARTTQHLMCHMPKNPYCDICRRSRMYRRKVTKKRHDPLADRGELEEVTKFGQRLALDFIIITKSHKSDKESVVLVIRDEFSGYMSAFPCARRNADFIVKSVLAFLGPSYHAHPTIMCKTDCAPELMSACTTLGFVHEPTLARRWPHNSVMEREIRTLEELTRASHLGAGFHVMTDLWTHSVQYAAIVMNAFHPIKDSEGNQHNRHELASGKSFDGRQLILGQLIYVRKDPLNRHKFDANAVPALFAGWRFDSGPKSHKGVYLTLDYAAIKDKSPGYSVALSVPCEEVYIPPGDPILPLLAAAEAALADFSDPSLVKYLPKEVPFSSLPSDATPAVRHEYITLDRIIRFGPTPDCKACSEMKGRHSSRCKARFDSLVKAEKAAKVDKSPSMPVEGRTVAEEDPIEVPAEESALDVPPEDLPVSAGIPPGHPEAAMINKTASTIDMSFVQSSLSRARFRRMNHLKGDGTIFEFACSDDSIIGQHASAIGVNCVRLTRSVLDLCDHEHMQQAIGQLEAQPGADSWASVTCTHHSPIQSLNLHMHGEPYAKKLKKKRAESEVLLQYAIQFLERTLELGGRAAFELPAENQLWNDPQLLAFEERAGLKRVYFNGCALNLKGKKGKYLKKPWCVTTSDLRMIQFLSQYQCDGSHEHEESLGKNAAQSAFYTDDFANVILEAWYPKQFYKHIPDLSSKSNALVTKNLTRSQWKGDEKAIQAIQKEAEGLRANATWDDSSVTPLHVLKRRAKENGEEIKIAEVLTLAGIKHSELSEEYHRYKGRIVYRGDLIRNQVGEHVFFAENETATTPTTIAALNLTLWYGLMTCVSCADCVQAYLQCKLDGNTWVILPFELWLDEWKAKYDQSTKLAVRLVKSLYGHPQSGNLWQAHLEKQLAVMKGVPIEQYPSNFVFRRGQNQEHVLILNVYVDDLTLSGGTKEVQMDFWNELKTKIKIDPPEFIDGKGTKILGRIHKIERGPKENVLTYDMKAYAKGIVEFFCEMTGTQREKLRKVTTPCLPESNMTNEELSNVGELGSFASRILMRCLWISRLARPDIAFAVQRLASRVTRWTKWEDRQMYRLVSYLHSTSEHVMKLRADPGQPPTLQVFTDSDFASCPHTAKSTSGIVYQISTGESRFLVTWQSKKQSSTARSTTEAELISCASALFGESLCLHSLLEALSEQKVDIIFMQDNQATITVIRSGYSAKLRNANRVHRVNLASIHEQLEAEVFAIEYCQSEMQVANSLTKVMQPMHWTEALKQLCIQP